ncbi:acetyl esterase [Fontimonas thermophila]|uniref:Acetyl esterase n=1 Tax=Fontimonas thermophila TaxID=1076937 RepID=A0A1I2KSH6_9GAMM|nr:alpha/beta hydrolase [Fontimonas thermophila]SFF67876.1 acetyl esterase [Fontimonas thermophila]
MTALNPHARQVLDQMAASGAPTLDQLTPVQARAAAQAGFLMLQGPKPEVASTADLKAEGPAGPIPLRVYRPLGRRADERLPACLYFHGGGFVIGDLTLYDNLCRILANAARCAVIAVDYRLAPEARFPAAVDDCWAATRWVAARADELRIDAQRLAVAGDSAGGNLAAVVALMARDAGGPGLRHQLLIYPVVQVAETESFKRNADGYFLTAKLMQYFVGHYLGDNAAALSDWRLAPILAASHAGLPPASILVCGFDPLHDDGVAYADTLRSAGVAVKFTSLPDQIHGFVCMDGAIPAARPAIEALGRELAASLT